MITKETVAEKIQDYLQHELSLAELVDWSERVMMDEEVDEHDAEVITHVVSQLGVADVTNFGLLWEDCDKYLHLLGYDAKVELVKVH